MKLFKALLMLSMFALAIVYWISSQPKQDLDLASIAESVAQDITVEDMQGKKFQLSELKGKNILLNFWATWCAPCVQEFPDLEKFAQWAGENSQLTVVAVSIDQKKADVERFLNKNRNTLKLNSNFRVFISSDASAAQRYGTTKFPESFFIDKSFQVKRKFIGIQRWNSEEIRKWVMQQS